LILTPDGSARGTATGDSLYLLLNGTTLEQTISGLNVTAAGITETELHTSVAGAGLAGGGGTALSVNVDDSSIEINVDTLRVKAAGITNAMLLNDSMTISDGGGVPVTFDLALGDTLIVDGGQSITIDTTVADTVTINAVVAEAAVLGVASFNDAAFTVTAGDVSFNQSEVSFTLNGDTGTQTVAGGDTMTVAGGTGIDTIVAATDTVTVSLNATAADLTNVGADPSAIGQVMVADGSSNLQPVAMQYVYSSSGVAATSHTINHALGQKYVNVTVLDASDEVIIPESITFTDANNVAVTFNTAIHCRVVVMGIVGVAATNVVLT